MNSSKGSFSSPLGVARPESMGTPGILAAGVPPISTLALSLTFQKFTVSVPARPWCGIMGGFIWRISAHCVDRKKGCVLTSDAPARAPRRLVSSLINSLRIKDLHSVDVCCAPDPSGKFTSSRKMLANVAFRFLPLKGVVPYSIS